MGEAEKTHVGEVMGWRRLGGQRALNSETPQETALVGEGVCKRILTLIPHSAYNMKEYDSLSMFPDGRAGCLTQWDLGNANAAGWLPHSPGERAGQPGPL